MRRLAAVWIVLRGVPASAERWRIRVCTTADCLANDRVDRGARDPLGYLWFATIDGISRLDRSVSRTPADDCDPQRGASRCAAACEASLQSQPVPTQVHTWPLTALGGNNLALWRPI